MTDSSPQLTPNNQLWRALYDADLEAAEQALAAGANIEAPSAAAVSPFLHFAGEGKMEQARWLAKHGANVNARDRLRQTALHRLALRSTTQVSKDHEYVQELIDFGVDPSLLNASGAPAILLATVQRYPSKMVEAMMSAGVNIDQPAKSGATSLLAAVAHDHFELTLKMIMGGANPHVVDNMGLGLLHSVSPKAPAAFVDVLLKMVPDLDVNLPAKSGTTPLGLYAEFGNKDLIQILLENGADPNSRSANSFSSQATALMVLAATEGDPGLPAINLALAAGADVSLRDTEGRSAAWYAVNGRRELELLQDVSAEEQSKQWAIDNQKVTAEVLDLLVSAGLDPREPLGPDGLSPMSVAWMVPENSVSWINEMARLGFPAEQVLDDEHKGGQIPPPLFQAVMNKDISAVRALLALGASVGNKLAVEGAAGKTVMHTIAQVYTDMATQQAGMALLQQLDGKTGEAVEKHRQKVMDQLREKQAADREAGLEMLSELAHAAGTVDLRASNDRTPLMDFLVSGHMDMARSVLEYGADPWLKDDQGLNAAGVCLNAGNTPGLHAILNHARSTAQTNQLSGILIDAIYTSPEGGSRERKPFLHALLSLSDEPEFKAWLEERDENGMTPLIIAAATSQEDAVEMLLGLGADPNAQDDMGNTAIHHALTQKRSDIIRALRSANGSTDVANKEGFRAHDVALSIGKAFLVNCLNEVPDVFEGPWPIPDEVKAERDAGRSEWKHVSIRGLAPRKSARSRVLI